MPSHYVHGARFFYFLSVSNYSSGRHRRLLFVVPRISCLSLSSVPCWTQRRTMCCPMASSQKGPWLCRRRSDVTRTFTTRCSQLFSLVLKKIKKSVQLCLWWDTMSQRTFTCNKNWNECNNDGERWKKTLEFKNAMYNLYLFFKATTSRNKHKQKNLTVMNIAHLPLRL